MIMQECCTRTATRRGTGTHGGQPRPPIEEPEPMVDNAIYQWYISDADDDIYEDMYATEYVTTV